MGERGWGDNGGYQQITPSSRSKTIFHVEERLIGENIDLDVLFVSLENMKKTHLRQWR
jgi:hypothetical protein